MHSSLRIILAVTSYDINERGRRFSKNRALTAFHEKQAMKLLGSDDDDDIVAFDSRETKNELR